MKRMQATMQTTQVTFNASTQTRHDSQTQDKVKQYMMLVADMERLLLTTPITKIHCRPQSYQTQFWCTC